MKLRNLFPLAVLTAIALFTLVGCNLLGVCLLGHSWDDGTVTLAATCESEGILTKTCKTCGATETETLAALGHAYGAWAPAENGHERVCTNDPSHKDSAAHNGGYTVNADGTHSESCDTCGFVGAPCTAALGAWEATADGHTRTCAAGHTESAAHTKGSGELTLAATATENGLITYVCGDCEEEYTVTVPAGTKVTTRADVEAGIAEVAWAYYMKGARMQYDSKELTLIGSETAGSYFGGIDRHTSEVSPEYGTAHTTIYNVCSSYMHNVYLEALDRTILERKYFPRGLSTYYYFLLSDNQHEADYVAGANGTTDEPYTENDADLAIVRWMKAETRPFAATELKFHVHESPAFTDFAEKTSWSNDDTLEFREYEDGYSYFLDDEPLSSSEAKKLVKRYLFAKDDDGNYLNIRPGDIMTDDTHSLIYIGNGYVLDCSASTSSGNGKYITSTGVDRVEPEGSVYGRTRTVESTLDTASEDYVVTRPLDLYADDRDGDPSNDVLLWEGEPVLVTEATESRLEYPAIDIDRTVSITPYGTAVKGETLTYSIKIRNGTLEPLYVNWAGNEDGVDYADLVVTERIPTGTEFVSATGDPTLRDGVLTWTLDVPAGETAEVSFTVRVTERKGTIVSEGGFVDKIPSNRIENTVGGDKIPAADASVLATIAAAGDVTAWKTAYGTDLAFAEALYAAMGLELELPTVTELVEKLFTPTYLEKLPTLAPWFYPDGHIGSIAMYVPQKSVATEYKSYKDMLVTGFMGGYRLYAQDYEKLAEVGIENFDYSVERNTTIKNFKTDFLEVGDILVYAKASDRGRTTLTSATATTRVLVYAGNATLLEMTSGGTGKIHQGSAAEEVLTASFKSSNDIFFLLRPSQAGAVVSHNWQEISTTPATCEAEGTTLYRCTGCSLCNGSYATMTATLSALGHAYGTTVENRDETTHTLTCTRTGCTHTTHVPHTWDNGMTSQSGTLYTCTATGCGATRAGGPTLTADQMEALGKLNYASSTSVDRYPITYVQSVYAKLGLPGFLAEIGLTESNGTAGRLLGLAFTNVGSVNGSGYSLNERQYVLKNGINAATTALNEMMIADFYGGNWIRNEKDGATLADAATTKGLSLADLQEGDVLVLGLATSSSSRVQMNFVYQGEGVFIGAAFYSDNRNFTVDGETTTLTGQNWRGTMVFDPETGAFVSGEFCKSRTSTAPAVTNIAIGTATFTDLLTEDPFLGLTWNYFFAIRPCSAPWSE